MSFSRYKFFRLPKRRTIKILFWDRISVRNCVITRVCNTSRGRGSNFIPKFSCSHEHHSQICFQQVHKRMSTQSVGEYLCVSSNGRIAVIFIHYASCCEPCLGKHRFRRNSSYNGIVASCKHQIRAFYYCS